MWNKYLKVLLFLYVIHALNSMYLVSDQYSKRSTKVTKGLNWFKFYWYSWSKVLDILTSENDAKASNAKNSLIFHLFLTKVENYWSIHRVTTGICENLPDSYHLLSFTKWYLMDLTPFCCISFKSKLWLIELIFYFPNTVFTQNEPKLNLSFQQRILFSLNIFVAAPESHIAQFIQLLMLLRVHLKH